MIEKIKNILFNVSIFYSVVIVILMIVVTSNIVTTIELSDTKENKDKIVEYKKQVSLLKQTKCIKIINKIIKHYEETSYDGKINIKEMYDYDFDNSLIGYYLAVKEDCNITDEVANQYNLPDKFITASIQRDELYQRYYFQYELGLVDFYMRDIGEAALSGIEYKINRDTELEIISDLIEISSKEVIINE